MRRHNNLCLNQAMEAGNGCWFLSSIVLADYHWMRCGARLGGRRALTCWAVFTFQGKETRLWLPRSRSFHGLLRP
jgi:hypothetical protein